MRARNIKPGFFDNEDLAEGGPCAQVLFEGLWCLADREGRLENRPLRIKAKVFPYYDPKEYGGKDINDLLIFLADKRFLRFYSVDGLNLISILNFKKHQAPHSTEKKSTLPPPPEPSTDHREPTVNFKEPPEAHSELTVNPPLNNGEPTTGSQKHLRGNPPDSLIHGFTDSTRTPSSPPQAGDDSPEISKGRAKGNNGTVPYQKIQASWNQYAPPLLPRVRVLDDKRKRLIKAAWQEHPEISWFEEFFRDIALSDHHSGKNDRGWTPDIGWILNERVRLQEKFESLKQAHAPQEVRHRARDPACPRCGGKGLYEAGQTPDGQPAMRECNCSEVMNGPKQSQARDSLHAPGES